MKSGNDAKSNNNLLHSKLIKPLEKWMLGFKKAKAYPKMVAQKIKRK